MASPSTALVSVVIPSYNRAHLVRETIESCLAQTYRPLEIVVVDDGSTDGTDQVLAAYGDPVRYIRKANGGLSSARNAGFAAARGEFVAWLDADDLAVPDRIAMQAAVLQSDPSVVLVSSDFAAFDENGPRSESEITTYYSSLQREPGGLAAVYADARTWGGPDAPWPAAVRDHDRVVVRAGSVYERLVHGNVIHPPTTMMLRDAALAAGGLDESLWYSGDWEFFVRLTRGRRAAYIDAPLIRYRYSEDQLSGDRYLRPIRQEVLRVLAMAEARDPTLRLMRDHRFARRVGRAHLSLAMALADDARAEARSHVWSSLREGVVSPDTFRALAMVLLPLPVVTRYRARRRRTPPARA